MRQAEPTPRFEIDDDQKVQLLKVAKGLVNAAARPVYGLWDGVSYDNGTNDVQIDYPKSANKYISEEGFAEDVPAADTLVDDDMVITCREELPTEDLTARFQLVKTEEYRVNVRSRKTSYKFKHDVYDLVAGKIVPPTHDATDPVGAAIREYTRMRELEDSIFDIERYRDIMGLLQDLRPEDQYSN